MGEARLALGEALRPRGEEEKFVQFQLELQTKLAQSDALEFLEILLVKLHEFLIEYAHANVVHGVDADAQMIDGPNFVIHDYEYEEELLYDQLKE